MSGGAGQDKDPAWRSRALTAVTCGAVLLLAGLAELFADCLDATDESFFSTCAQVAPVFGLAVFVEIVVAMSLVMKSDGSSAVKEATVRYLVRTNACLLVISEGAALYAVGSGFSSTFLVVCVLAPWAGQVLLLVDTAYLRIGLNRIGRHV